MTKLNVKDPGFTFGVRIADSIPFVPALMNAKDAKGAIVALHAVKGAATVTRILQDFTGLCQINGKLHMGDMR